MMRTTIVAGVIYTAALSLWILGKLWHDGATSAAGVVLFDTIILTQCLVVVLLMPLLAESGYAVAGIPLIVTPWPLLLLTIELASGSLAGALASQLSIALLAATAYFGTTLAHRLLNSTHFRDISTVMFQAVPASLLWYSRAAWSGWFSGWQL